jgi:hypothetical protein
MVIVAVNHFSQAKGGWNRTVYRIGEPMTHLGTRAGVACCGSGICDTAAGEVDMGTTFAFCAADSENAATCVNPRSAGVDVEAVEGGRAMSCRSDRRAPLGYTTQRRSTANSSSLSPRRGCLGERREGGVGMDER